MSEKLSWCHVYAQPSQHAEVLIEGDREALLKIRDAIDKALHSGQDTDSDHLFTSDGEGYHVTVKIRNLRYLEQQTLPYTASYAGGVWRPAD